MAASLPSAAVAAAAISGDRNQAFEYLEKAYSDADDELLIVIRNPALDPLRSDPRYPDLMRKLGLPEWPLPTLRALRALTLWPIILAMSQSLRHRRIARAEELATRYPFAAEMLRFFVPVARFQDELYCYAQKALKDQEQNVSFALSFAQPLAAEVMECFPEFLSLVERIGPGPVAAAARELRSQTADHQRKLLNAFWTSTGALVVGDEDRNKDGDQEFFARAFLQPYAEFVREQAEKQQAGPTPCLCPFCSRKPGVGVLRPLGDGGQRSLVCSFCLGEWEFRRIVCPGCGEEDHSKLPVYTAEEFKHVRVECCDTCRNYIKTVDLTRNGLADPVVDEIASIPLDLWAQKQGYTKLQANLMLL